MWCKISTKFTMYMTTCARHLYDTPEPVFLHNKTMYVLRPLTLWHSDLTLRRLLLFTLDILEWVTTKRSGSFRRFSALVGPFELHFA